MPIPSRAYSATRNKPQVPDHPNTPIKHSLRTAAILLAFTVAGTALLALTFQATRGPIEQNQQAAKRALIGEILPYHYYDNDLLASAVPIVPDPLLGNSISTTAYRATRRGAMSAVVFEATAPDGYSGKIRLLLAVLANGELAGVRVIAHNETPGLGDYIDKKKSDWIDAFRGRSLMTSSERDWQVKKDGGNFDYVTGATITPRAIVKAVHKALQYFALHRARFSDRPDEKNESGV